LPKLCKYAFLNGILTPLYLIYYSIKLKANLILAYHFIPHGFFAYIAALVTRKQYIIGQTGLYIQKYAQKPIFGKIIVHIAKNAFSLNVPGTTSKEFWINKGISANKINILHSTIDSNYFVSDYKNKNYDFIFLGRLSPEKQIHHIIESLYKLHLEGLRPTMVIVGEGEEEERLKKLVLDKSLEDYVNFVGFKKDTKKWFNKASIFVMSSKSEGLPTALMQALSCGLICISSDVGNVSDIIKHHESGFLFQNSDQTKLTIIMKDALKNQNQYNSMRLKARQTVVDNHSYNSAINKWQSLINDMLNS
jgi:glycosyltransferase involved in cell wall biosynthesis